ncbi:MAG: hypothetical protein HYX93_01720 [Chloroflexi bacterium]|nr:hypothetical protein [Chloroflexota bacterium]
MASPIPPNLQYAIFCTQFVEEHGHTAILGVLDAVDVQGTIKRGQPMPRKVFPITLVLGITAPEGDHRANLEISRPSGGIGTTIDLESFTIPPGEALHRCVATLEMEAPEDGTYTFHAFLDGSRIGWAALPVTFNIEYEG